MAIDPNNKTYSLPYGGDFQVSPTGGLVMVEGWEEVKQRIIRRLLTNPRFRLSDKSLVPADYIFHQDYGLGVPRKVGEPLSEDLRSQLTQKVNEAVSTDAGEIANGAPIVKFFPQGNSLWIQIGVLLKSKETGIIVFQVV